MAAREKAIIIGAGPAGLTAAFELLKKTDIEPIIFEASGDIGGISKTINHEGNRMDIGGHRFFSKSERVMNWWLDVLPLQGAPAKDDLILERNPAEDAKGPDPEKTDIVMLVRNRLSRILYLRKFFNYPVSLDAETFNNLGIVRVLRIGFSYMRAKAFPIRHEKSLEDFLINRFGRELYLTFFKDYTEKVWGVPCEKIRPEWGAQRIKGISVTTVIKHALKKTFSKSSSIYQKETETSLIERFMYPKLGPGQLWEQVAKTVTDQGAQLFLNFKVVNLRLLENRIAGVTVKHRTTGDVREIEGDYVFSTMPVRDLIAALEGPVPENVAQVAAGLEYRDFITVGVLLKKLQVRNNTKTKTINNIVPDNWIYVQEKDVKLGRIQIFNNWSPYMVKDAGTVWLGLEYFCREGDWLWEKADRDMADFAIDELEKIGFVDKKDVLDSVVVRVEKAYPAYFGTYDQFSVIEAFTNSIPNLFLIGRNGMHRYNNQDHSMLTAMQAVDNIANKVAGKENLWTVNTEKVYHETASK